MPVLAQQLDAAANRGAALLAGARVLDASRIANGPQTRTSAVALPIGAERAPSYPAKPSASAAFAPTRGDSVDGRSTPSATAVLISGGGAIGFSISKSSSAWARAVPARPTVTAAARMNRHAVLIAPPPNRR